MMKNLSITIGLIVVILFALSGGATDTARRSYLNVPLNQQYLDEEAKARVAHELQRLPLYFIENKGQLDPRVAYYVQGKDKTLYFTQDGITYVLTEQDNSLPSIRKASLEESIAPDRRSWVVKLDFVGASVRPKGLDSKGATINYFKGKPGEWRTGLKTYGKVVYEDLWPGIDLVYSGTQDRLKYEFVVHPGADPGQIRLAYRGAELSLTDGGRLHVGTPVASFQDEKPYAYQGTEGAEQEVSCSYKLEAYNNEGRTYGFDVGPYDRTKSLVLDPAVLVYSGFIGGSSDDHCIGIAVDQSGNAYVCGATISTGITFPVKTGPDLTYNGGTYDAFVARVKADGTGLVYCGYIGGDSEEIAWSIAVDQSGNAYICGRTNSTQTTFPVVTGPDVTWNGSDDAFVAKVKADGTELVYCGYIGGNGYEVAYGIGVDQSGNAYVCGYTGSTEASFFPIKAGPDLTYNGGNYDAFVARIKTDGTELDYCGYIGGSGSDYGYGIAVDSNGNVYVCGSTGSTEITFPVQGGPDVTWNGSDDAFVAKVKADGSSLVYCGYIGGTSEDAAWGIAVDQSGNTYVCGYAKSTETTFPVKIGPGLSNKGGDNDAFVAKVKADGTDLVYCGYIGGSGQDNAIGIAVDSKGDAYVSGYTNSTESTFPVKTGPDLTYNGGYFDAFVAKVKADGSSLVYCGYIGGSGEDDAWRIGIDQSGNTYVCGYTGSTEATFPLKTGPDLTYNGGDYDAFIAKIRLTYVPLDLLLLE